MLIDIQLYLLGGTKGCSARSTEEGSVQERRIQGKEVILNIAPLKTTDI